MLDVETGRFVIGEGMEFYPGMTKEEFIKSSMFQNELRYPEADKETDPVFRLKTQTIDGFPMLMTVIFSKRDYVEYIMMSKPEFYNWPDWPKDKTWEEYADEIKAYNDAFVEKQIEGTVRGGSTLKFSYPWGAIQSSMSLRDIPVIEVEISYSQVAILESKGYDFSKVVEEILGITGE